MKRYLPDTSIFVDFERRARHRELLTSRTPSLILSAVVAAELLSGNARAAALVTSFEKRRRLLVPTVAMWKRAGDLRRSLAKQGITCSLTDVLIATSARAIGATLMTRDAEFKAIALLEKFDLEVVS